MFTGVFVSAGSITKTTLAVYEYEFLITAITNAKAKCHINRYDGCFHENLSEHMLSSSDRETYKKKSNADVQDCCCE